MLGLVCMYIDNKGKNLLKCNTLQLGRYKNGLYSEEKIRKTYIDNAYNLYNGLDKIISDGIKLFRFSSELIPLADKVPNVWWNNSHLASIYKMIGDKCKKNNVRCTFHPGQFCVLNSERDSVIENSIRELEIHAWIFDACGFDESPHYAINIHAGSKNNFNKLINTLSKLNTNIKNRLTIENCEFAANIKQLSEVSNTTKIPIVFDSHHHTFNHGNLSIKEAIELCRKTWPNSVKSLQHISNSRDEYENGNVSQKRKHSDFIKSFPPDQHDLAFKNEIDIDIEAKMKNYAVHQCAKDFSLPL